MTLVAKAGTAITIKIQWLIIFLHQGCQLDCRSQENHLLLGAIMASDESDTSLLSVEYLNDVCKICLVKLS